MKTIKLLTHPIFLGISFLIVIISGEHVGGFYFIYLVLGLIRGSVHSILGLLGIGLLLFTFVFFKRKNIFKLEPFLNIASCLMLGFSLYMFFYNDKGHYNSSTFYQMVPLVMLSLYGSTSIGFLVYNLMALWRKVQ